MGFSSSKYESTIYNYLTTTCGFNCAAACGILANLYYESGLIPMNLQDSYNKSLGMTDAEYTSAVDNKSYTNFVNDSAGYGLAQWTFSTRKQGLLNLATSKGVSIGNASMQLEYLIKELSSGSYSSTYNTIKSCSNDANGAYQVAYTMCKDFERPAGGESTYTDRANYAKSTVFPAYKSNQQPVSSSDIISTAKSFLGKPYSSSQKPPSSFTSYGFVQYCYSLHDISIPGSAVGQAQLSQNYITENYQPGDILLFYGDTRRGGSVATTALAVNATTAIGCMGYTGYMEVSQFSITSSPWSDRLLGAVRILNGGSGQSSGSSYTGYVSDSPSSATQTVAGVSSDSIALSSGDSYASNMTSALSVLEAAGGKYSSVVNLRTGDEFRFYLNDSVSESHPVSYSTPGNILGRSVPVLGYDSTGARTVSINLTLYAGTAYRPGLTSTTEDPVGVLHSDLDLLKSFEYPDYSSAVVIPPAPVLLSIEGTLKIRGAIQNVSVDYSRPLDEKGRAMVANVSFTVTQVSDDPPSDTDIKNRTTKSY